MQANRKEKHEKELLICCHSKWESAFGNALVPEGVSIYFYAPLGAALSQSILRALADGVKIKPGDLTISSIHPHMLYKIGLENSGEFAGNYRQRDHEVATYPMLYHQGEMIPNYVIASPGQDMLEESAEHELEVFNVPDQIQPLFILDVLKAGSGQTYHFGGCAWMSNNNERCDIVTFKDEKLERKFMPEINGHDIRLLLIDRAKK